MFCRIDRYDELVEEILDQLPTEVWTSATTRFLDPAMASGQFVWSIEKRLKQAGHSDENIRSRVFGFEKNKGYVQLAINMNSLIGTYEVRSYDSLFTWNSDMKFDVVVGNPPYQKADKSGRDDDNLWPKFIAKSIDLAVDKGHVALITPASWASLGSNREQLGSKIRRNYFDPYQVVTVDFTVERFFNVGSTFSAFIIKKTKPESDTRLVFKNKTVIAKFSEYPCIPLNFPYAEFVEIIQNFKSRSHYQVVWEDPHPQQRASMVKKIEQGYYSRERSQPHPYRAYHTNAQTTLYSNNKNSFHSEWKVVASYSGTWRTEVTNDCSLTDASFCILCKSENEALSVQSVLSSRPIKFLIDKVFRWSGYYNAVFISMIPALPQDKIYTEEEVMDLLFTEDQAKIIKTFL